MPHQTKSILIIEDHAPSCDILKDMFHRHGMQAECAARFEEGVTIARVRRRQGKPFSCVLTDLGLPDSKPEETVTRLHEFDDTPVRAISGMTDPEIIEACRRTGIKLILKGTSAEGIFESILYAIADHEPSPEIPKMIAQNRPVTRELIPPHHTQLNGFFSNWSPLWKGVLAFGSILSIMLTALTVGGILYKSIEEKAVGVEKNKEHLVQVDVEQKLAKEERQQAFARIRVVEDANIKIFAKLDELSGKIDGIKNDYRIDRETRH